MEQKMNRNQLLSLIKEEMSRMNESGFDNYDMQPQTPVTKQQQIDASWDEFNNNNKRNLNLQKQRGEVESYLDSNINTTDFNGQLGMDAMSQNPDIAIQGQMSTGTPRNIMKNSNDYEKRKYGTYGESKKGKVSMSENQFKSLVRECLMEVIAERKQLKESDEFNPSGYRTVSNMGGHEVQIHPSGDSARFKFYGGQPTDWMEIEFDENGAAYVETGRGRELLANYMRYQ